ILHPSEVLDRLDSLVDKSLVLFENSTAPHSEIRNAHRAPESALPRYRMLETVREYALERLRESGEEQIVRARHAGHYRGLAEQARPFLEPPQPAWLDRLETEHDNLRAALNTYGAREATAEGAVQLAAVLTPFWLYRAHFYEARAWLIGLARRSTLPS